jgi:hypothetical protein
MGKAHKERGYYPVTIYLSPAWLPAYRRARAMGYTPLDLLMAGVLAALASEPQEVRVRAEGARVRRLPRTVVEAWRARRAETEEG